ncbi:hypothetical protein [Variovorax boronicumulans]|uniref:hypothetical protein n=1 Tax=Variovorax boronicumulans TaxID=436515 RepID=UPI0012E50877|nr:hypothetical protein [Variovorax boronicumulans]GER16678.1 hypothetical protein VCH24_16840 [Variovorax boronicumulans]
MATITATYDVRDDFNGTELDVPPPVSSWTGLGVAPYWNANFPDYTLSGGRFISDVLAANVTLSVNPSEVGFDSRVVKSMTVETQFGRPVSNANTLRVEAWNDDFSVVLSPEMHFWNDDSVQFGFYENLETVALPSASSHVFNIVVIDRLTVEFYCDGVLLGTRTAPAINWRENILLSIRNGSWVEYIHVFGEDIATSTPPEPEPKGVPFWTGFVNAYEAGVAAAPPGPDPGTPGESHLNPIDITTPFESTLGVIDSGTPIWYRMTLGANNWKFSTVTSPDPQEYDTFLALYDAAGVVVMENEDVTDEDFRSEIVAELSAGTYYLAITSYGGNANDDFELRPGETDVPAGTVLVVDSA